MIKIETKVVWISDIHLREAYTSNPAKTRVNHLFDDLIRVLTEENELSLIDYIIVSGDIAFKGSEGDYKILEETFLKKLYKSYKIKSQIPKILTIPGNHDISWNDVNHIGKYIFAYTKSNEFPDRLSFFKSRKPAFEKSFLNYSNYFSQENFEKEIWESFFEFPENNLQNQRLYIHPEYKAKRLYGYLVDFDKEIIFVFLNTAWFSIGDFMNQLFVNQDPGNLVSEVKKNDDQSEFDEKFVKALDLKSTIVEFGNQIVGAEDFPIEDLQEHLLNNPKFPVIAVAHHPTSWLLWNELYSYDQLNTKTALGNILSYSDVLLTGHEHVPINKSPERDVKGLIHLKGGMFMEDDISKRDYFKHSRFSILDISNKQGECKINERKFLFSHENNKWEELIKFKIDFKINKSELLCVERQDKLEKGFIKLNLKKYLSDKIKIDEKDINEIEFKEEGEYLYYSFQENNTIRSCFLINEGTTFLNKLLYDPSLSSLLEKNIHAIAKKYPGSEIKIQFFFSDILIAKEELVKPYLDDEKKARRNKEYFSYPEINIDLLTNTIRHSPTGDAIEIYSNITRYVEQKFNNFRNAFFGKFEREYSNNGCRFKKTKKKEFIKKFTFISGIKFTCDTISYWTLERNLNG